MVKKILLALGLVAALAGAFASLASGSSGPRAHAAAYAVGLNVQGGYANQNIRACGSANHYNFHRPRRRIDFKGTVSPPPNVKLVKVKIKKCVRGRFIRFKELHVRVDSRGSYQGSFTLKGRGFYFIRTYFYGVRPAARSPKRHLRIA